MKFFLLVIVGIGLGIWVLTQGVTTFKIPITTNTAQPSASSVEEIIPHKVTFNTITYAIYIAKISNTNNVSLIPNFTEKNTGATTYTDNQCQILINGGFYTTENTPLGLFYVDGGFLEKNRHPSNILNGYVYKTKNGGLEISQNLPKTNQLEFAFQSGPFFSQNQRLTISPDSYDRRSLLGTANDGMYAISITQVENTSSGPYLADIPQILTQIPISFTQFINLDGGSASSLYTKNIHLGELTTVGSFLCLRS